MALCSGSGTDADRGHGSDNGDTIMPAKSQAQFKMMQGIAHGGIKPKGGLTPDVASEYVKGQSPKGLPPKAPTTVNEFDRTGASAKKGKPGFGK